MTWGGCSKMKILTFGQGVAGATVLFGAPQGANRSGVRGRSACLGQLRPRWCRVHSGLGPARLPEECACVLGLEFRLVASGVGLRRGGLISQGSLREFASQVPLPISVRPSVYPPRGPCPSLLLLKPARGACRPEWVASHSSVDEIGCLDEQIALVVPDRCPAASIAGPPFCFYQLHNQFDDLFGFLGGRRKVWIFRATLEQRLRSVASTLLTALAKGGSKIEPRTIVEVGHVGDEILDGIAFESLRTLAGQAVFVELQPSGRSCQSQASRVVFVLLHHDFKHG